MALEYILMPDLEETIKILSYSKILKSYSKKFKKKLVFWI